MRQANNGAGDKKNISKHPEEKSKYQASREDEQLHQRSFRFLSEKDKAAFKKFRKRACQRQQICQQTGMPRRIAGPSRVADHSTAARSTPEDQAQDEPDSERGKDRLSRVFAHVLLG